MENGTPKKRNLTRKKKIGIALISLCILSLFSVVLYDYMKKNYVRVLGPIPDPFLFNNGTSVVTQQDWDLRRVEIKEMMMDIQYGTIPGRPDALNVSVKSSETYDDGTELKILTFSVIPSNSSSETIFNFSAWVFVPNSTGPFPVVLKVSPDGTGSQVPVHTSIIARDYLYICFNHTNLDPDTQGYDIVGPAQIAYPEYTWGSLAVWAWGAMRVVDFIYREPWVHSDYYPDAREDQIIITGHSRRGKVALFAAAFDERIQISAPSGSGCGGVGSYLVLGPGAETLGRITDERKFKAWFKEDFGQFAGNEADLPFDQHFLRALVAPRHVLSLTGVEDLWANPLGTQVMYKAAAPVFEFFDVPTHNAIRYREGGHSFIEPDFQALMDFGDMFFFNAEVDQDFYMTPYSNPVEISYISP